MKRIEKFAFAMLATTILFALNSCEKGDPEFSFVVNTYITQSKNSTGDYVYNLYFGMLGYNEIIKNGTASISLNNTPIDIVSHVPGSYESLSFQATDIRAFNGTYFFTAASTNLGSASFSQAFSFQDVPLDEFTIEDFKYENGSFSAKFKNIDSDASLCGFYINPNIDNVPAVSKIYVTMLGKEITPGVSETTVSLAFQDHPDYNGLRVYPMISKVNGNIRQMLLGSLQNIAALP